MQKFFKGVVVEPRVIHRELDTYPDLVKAKDVFARQETEDGRIHFVLTNPSKPYSKDW